MKKSVKAITGLALGAGAALLAAGEVMYHCILNTDIQHFMASKGLFRNEEEDKFWAENEIYQSGIAWYNEVNPEILTIFSTLGRDMRSEFIPAEKNTDNWAIVIHGYSGDPATMAHYAWKYHTLGFDVIIPHMVGHDSDSVRYCSMGYHDKTVIKDWISYIIRPMQKFLCTVFQWAVQQQCLLRARIFLQMLFVPLLIAVTQVAGMNMYIRQSRCFICLP